MGPEVIIILKRHPSYYLIDMCTQSTANEIALTLKPNDYAICVFDGFCRLLLVDLINMEEEDVTCKFMHPRGSAYNFHWSHTDDTGHVPFNRFIMTVETPEFSSSGRQFLIKEQELKHTKSVYENLK